MSKHGKKHEKARSLLDLNKTYSVQEGLAKIKEVAYARFDESIDINTILGIDPTKGEQVVRGSVILPHGTGKKVKILVFAKGDYAQEAQKAGADYVGTDDLIAKIESGWLDFNIAIATPDLMGLVGKVAKKLGPRGLLPNKKLGTVTFDIGPVVADLKSGRLFFKNDKSGHVHFRIGRRSFTVEQLAENFNAFVKALSTAKPPTSKGKFLRRITVASTMGPGVRVAVDEA